MLLSDTEKQRIALAFGYEASEYLTVPNIDSDFPLVFYNKALVFLGKLEGYEEEEEDCRQKIMAIEVEDLKVDFSRKLLNIRLESRSIVDQLSRMLDIPVRRYRVHLPVKPTIVSVM